MTGTDWRTRWKRQPSGRVSDFSDTGPQVGAGFWRECVRFSGQFPGFCEYPHTVADMQQQQLMTLADVCELLGISESTAYYWRQIGKGPKGARIGKALRYRRSDVVAWLDEQFARA